MRMRQLIILAERLAECQGGVAGETTAENASLPGGFPRKGGGGSMGWTAEANN